MNISQGLLPFQLIQNASKVLLTSFGGLALVMETFRALDLPRSIQKHLSILERQGKYREADYIESFISVFAGDGDHLLGIAARVVEHGRKLFFKIVNYHPSFLLYKEARKKLVLFSSA